VREGDAVLELHYRDRGRLDRALALAQQAIGIGDSRPARRPLILEEVHQ
jgi:thymidine phosphorylase